MKPFSALCAAAGMAVVCAASASAQEAPLDLNGVWQATTGLAYTPNIRPSDRQHPPLKGEYAELYERRVAAAERGEPEGDPTANCVPQGMPRIMTMPFPMEITQAKDRMLIYAEWNMAVRRIYLDGRDFPPADELDPSYYGYSIGRWVGNELHVETRGLRDDTVLDASGIPKTDAMIVKERFYQPDPDTLHDEITLTDEKAFSRPWTVTKVYKRRPHFTIMEYFCLENNRNPVDEDGVTRTILLGND